MASFKEQVARWSRLPARSGSTTARPDEAPAQAAHVPKHVIEAAVTKAPAKKVMSIAQTDNDRRNYTVIKSKLHQLLLSRIDLSATETMAPERLRDRLREITSKIIAEEMFPINQLEHDQIVSDLQNEIIGLGPLEPLLADPTISEIMVNGAKTVFVERRGQLELTDIQFNDDEHLLKIIDKIISRVGRRIDEASPMADARLPDGSRVNAIIPPLAIDGPSLSIRRFAVVALQMNDLVRAGALTRDMADLLAGLVKAKANIINITIKVAHAHPASPMGETHPGMPMTKTTDSGAFTNNAPTCTQVTNLGLPKLWLSVLYMRNSNEAGTPNATISK